VNFRPVYPIAIRTPEFFDNVNPLWFRYFMIDVHRVAQFLELPFQWPRPDPIVQIFDGGRPKTAPEQPYIYRLTRAGVVASERGHGIEFANQVSTLIWGGTESWHEGEHLAKAAQRAGLDLAELDRTASRETARIEAVIAQNQKDHEAAGHWGVPTCAFRGEPFFGQDRLDVLLWRLQQNGLRERD
jgi:2-hydroxychromene-2-carboxylate isomerase